MPGPGVEDEYLRKELARLAGAVEQLNAVLSNLDEKFLPRREWDEARRADAEAGKRLTEQVAEVKRFKDWMVYTIVGLVLIALVGLVVTGGPPQ